MSLTKAQLQGLNTTNFPNNTTGYITPALLRDFNSESIDSMALQTQVDSLSSSFQSQLNSLEDFSSSLVTNFATVAELNASSSTLQSQINTLATTSSVSTLSQSVYVQFGAQATVNSNTITRFNADELAFNQYTQSNNAAVAGKASLSQDNYFVGNQYVTGKITATGTVTGSNITSYALDTASFNSYTSSQNFTNSTLVTTSSFNTFSGSQYKADSASFSSRIEAVTGSGGNVNTSSLVTTASFNAYTSSNDSKVNSLIAATASYVTSAITGSSLITASVSQSTITFTKGDGSQFNIVVADVSGSAGNFVTTSSFNAYTQSTNDFTASISTSVGLLQTFSGSQYKADSSSFDSRIDSLEIASGGFITTGSITNSQTIFGNLTVSRSAASGQNAIDAQGNAYVTDTLKVGSLTISGSGEDGAINFSYPSTLVQSPGNITFRNFLNTPSPSYTGSISFNAVSGNINLSSTGGGFLSLNGIKYPSTDGTNGQVLTTNGSGVLTFTTASGGSVTGATTGSNSFTGSQTINGNIILTGSNAEIQNAKGVGFFNSLYNLDYSLAMPIQNTIGYIDELGLPHYYNGGVQPTISASAAIANHSLVKVTPQEWLNLTASAGNNHYGILSVETSTGWNDINNTFGVHGNAITSGSVNYITQRGLSKIGLFAGGGAQPYIGQPVYVDDNGYQLTLLYPTGSRVLRYGYVASFEQSDPLNMYVRQIFVDPVWVKGQTITDLNVSSSLTITGSLFVSSSNTSDIVVNGQVFISSSVSSSAGIAKLTISGSTAGSTGRAAQVVIVPTSVTLTRATTSGTQTISLNSTGGNISLTGPVATIAAAITTGSNKADLSAVYAVGAIDNEVHLSADANGIYLQDWDNTALSYSPWLSIGPNDGVTIPPVKFQRAVNFTSGSNKQTGLATLDGANPGAVVVSNTNVTANSIIMLTKQTLTNAHMVAVSSKGSGTFTITSNGNGDTDVVAFMIINPS